MNSLVAMESTLSILVNYVKEFVPANKDHFLAAGVGMVLIGLCIWLTAYTGGLHGGLTYLALAPGITLPLILGGIVCVVAALTMKLPPNEYE